MIKALKHLWFGGKDGWQVTSFDPKIDLKGINDRIKDVYVDIESYQSLQSRLDMAVECLKFYAAEENWEFTSDFHGHESYEEIKDDEECTAPCMSYGGKRAREVLKQINPKGG